MHCPFFEGHVKCADAAFGCSWHQLCYKQWQVSVHSGLGPDEMLGPQYALSGLKQREKGWKKAPKERHRMASMASSWIGVWIRQGQSVDVKAIPILGILRRPVIIISQGWWGLWFRNCLWCCNAPTIVASPTNRCAGASFLGKVQGFPLKACHGSIHTLASPPLR
jgi:hypothetical protein